jgi:vancomycin resistance protein YoaR
MQVRTLAFGSRLTAGLCLALLLLTAGLVVFRQVYDDRIYPAIIVGDVNVGGLTLAQAEARLGERAADLEQGTITFTYVGQTWTPTLSALGASMDLEQSIETARALGRTGDAASQLAFTRDLLAADQHVPLQSRLDLAVLSRWFDQVDAHIGQSAVDARLEVDGLDVSIVPETSGIAIDRELATGHIRTALARLEPVATDLPVSIDEPEITTADLLPIQATVEQMLANPVVVTFEDRQWQIDATLVLPLLAVETTLEQGVVVGRLDVDTEGLAAVLRTEFGDQVNREPVDAVIAWDDGVVVRESSIAGVTLRAGAFADAVADSFRNGHPGVQIPVVEVRPAIDGEHLELLGIDTLLGQGDSNFAGGVEGRDANVVLATELMDGTLVPPGGTFSFNDAIGEITYDRGFREALVVQGDGVGRGAGGGVCQVSTTIFRAALNAGMPITEWYAHSYRLSNYERDGWAPGFDASILQDRGDPADWPDFEFENDTDGWLLIESRVEYPYVYVNIYGSDDGRTVSFETWSLDQPNAFGVTRTIHNVDGEVVEERSFNSYYK